MALEKDKALNLLKERLNAIENIKAQKRFSQDYKKWYFDTKSTLENIFGKDSQPLTEFSDISYNDLLIPDRTPEAEFERAFQRGLENAAALLGSLITELESSNNQERVTITTSVSRILCILKQFHVISRQLTKRHANRSTIVMGDEYDVQDLLHALLRLDFEDVRDEEWTPSYAGATSRVDFLIKQEKIVIEAKKTRDGLSGKQVGEQLIIDIERYKVHPDCQTLICFVYDPDGRIVNPAGIENDLAGRHDKLNVIVSIFPK